MTLRNLAVTLVVWLASNPTALAQPYTAQVAGDIVQLADARTRMAVSVVPGLGNIGVALTVGDSAVVWWPYASLDEFAASPRMAGIPFLGPWANRLDEQAFYANGQRYAFDMALGNVRGEIPIHGFLTTAPNWQLVEAAADEVSAWATSRLDFYRQPTWMAQFPFAHTIEMTYRLHDGMLEVATRLHNLSEEPMPVAIGFHPYFQLTDSPRDEWTISVGARTRWLLDANKLPTGETEPIERLFPDPGAVPLADHDLDEVFADLVRDGSGRATMSVKGRRQQLEVLFGPNWRAAVVWAPRGEERNFVCFEPMAGVTNAMSLAHRGMYPQLQSIPPDGVWQASFWIRPSGF